MFTDSILHQKVVESCYAQEINSSLIQCATKPLKSTSVLHDRDMDRPKSVWILTGVNSNEQLSRKSLGGTSSY